jgi:late competence protein required for DNA uptake (superfamily II DNA/RNA helicase)
MAGLALSKTCVRHPDIAGFAVCMACRQVVCQECATTWDGINYCRECLAKKGVRSAAGSHRSPMLHAVSVIVASGLLAVAAIHALVWSVAMLVDWR